MLRWLSRLFRQRDEAETAPAPAPPLETPAPAVAEPVTSEAVVVAAAVEAPAVVPLPEAPADAEAKETCPTCGRTSVFAGPPGQRFCTYCALRDELFERSAAATE
ncbi:MAG: hypothetical protein E6J32_06705 [Chloroflexi bacterium]|nr:MAG: hypothetical protein E6J32_06705 [Chloroflexota bacterium]